MIVDLYGLADGNHESIAVLPSDPILRGPDPVLPLLFRSSAPYLSYASLGQPKHCSLSSFCVLVLTISVLEMILCYPLCRRAGPYQTGLGCCHTRKLETLPHGYRMVWPRIGRERAQVA
jgi:hypothetical protein